MNQPGKEKAFNYNLETLRGIATIAVLWGHSTVANGMIDQGTTLLEYGPM